MVGFEPSRRVRPFIIVTNTFQTSASLDKTVKVWRIPDLKCIETFQAHPKLIKDMLVTDDGVVFTASDDVMVRMWKRNVYGGDRPHMLIVTLPAKNLLVKALMLTPDSEVLYSGCIDGYIYYWFNGRFTGQLQYGGCLQGHTHAILCMESVENYFVRALPSWSAIAGPCGASHPTGDNRGMMRRTKGARSAETLSCLEKHFSSSKIKDMNS